MNNSKNISRRSFLALMSSTIAVLVAPRVFSIKDRKLCINQQLVLARKLGEIFDNSRLGPILRHFCLPVMSSDDSLKNLTTELCRSTDLDIQYLINMNAKSLQNIIDLTISKDFNEGQIKIFRGWVLSRTEVTLLTICSSKVTPIALFKE